MSDKPIKKVTDFSVRSSNLGHSFFNDPMVPVTYGIVFESLFQDKLKKKCRKLIDNLKKHCPEMIPIAPLSEGHISSPVEIEKETLTSLFRLALKPSNYIDERPPIIWQQGNAKVRFYPNETKVETRAGLILVGIVLESEQTGKATLTVPFATGKNGRFAGTVMTTETQPRGPELLVSRWGDAVIAAAYDALLQVTNGIAAEAGSDQQGRALRAGAIVTTEKGLTVIPQAYHLFENTLLKQNQPNTPISTLKKAKKESQRKSQKKNKGEQ